MAMLLRRLKKAIKRCDSHRPSRSRRVLFAAAALVLFFIFQKCFSSLSNSRFGIVYIRNHEHPDPEHNIQFQHVLKRTNMRVSHVPAVTIRQMNYELGQQVGCQFSHMEALQLALTSPFQAALIMEDDFVWHHHANPSYLKRVLYNVISTYPAWDVIGIGMDVTSYELPKPPLIVRTSFSSTTTLVRVKEADSSRAYLVHERYIPRLYETIKDCDLLGSKYHNLTLNDCWKVLPTTGVWYGMVPPLGYSGDPANSVCPPLRSKGFDRKKSPYD